MPINWDDVRYRGDKADVQELVDSYRISDYLEAFEENRRQRDLGIREHLIKDGIRLSERLSPRIYRVFRELCDALEIPIQAEVFCLPSAEVNAFAILDVREAGAYSLIGITAPALERLEDNELRSILGHELGHFLFGNNRLEALVSMDKDNPSLTVLPALGESLFLRWRKKAEISADRVGLLASRDFRASATSLLKATFGLSERNLNLDIEALVSQVDEIKGRPEMMEEAFASHPLLPIRLKALELFSRSAKAARAGFPVDGTPITDAVLEDGVDDLIKLTRRYPWRPLHQAIMRVVALGGALLLGADGDISDEEVKILVQILHRWFTDEPEVEIVTSREEVNQRLPEQVALVNKEADQDDKLFILSRLADIALADGALMDAESEVILLVAGLLEVPTKRAYQIMVGAAQSVGFRTDVKLNRMAEELRRSLQRGFRKAQSPTRPMMPPHGVTGV
ncbi:MAG: M48 family metallopeptidase [Vicinamibacterales bacterium]